MFYITRIKISIKVKIIKAEVQINIHQYRVNAFLTKSISLSDSFVKIVLPTSNLIIPKQSATI